MTNLISVIVVVLLVIAPLVIKENRRLSRIAQDKFNALDPPAQELQLIKVAARKKLGAQEALEYCRSMAETYFHGTINAAMVCPHCSTRGKVRVRHVVNKRGVSGGKATAAILTGGLSLLATGLSRKEQATEAYCDCCANTWTF